MSRRNLFVSFAESDGGHSYLAMRALLEPGSIAHLIFRNTVSESLEALAAGQSNYAVVPYYNSITQWEGATIKALATGQFEIFGQVCMPTSYVLVAHKDYLTEFARLYTQMRDPAAPPPPPEEEIKIYTRFLTRIFVGAQAEEQYRGRLIRPDMKSATLELTRNPLRVLEELSRSDVMKAMAVTPRQSPGQVGNTGISLGFGAPAPAFEALEAPAALVASGLLDAPGDPQGWDQPGSLGEIVALLRKLLVLLNVYSFGSPDLPENKTQYVLLGRRGGGAPKSDALNVPSGAHMRTMALVKPSSKKSSADVWNKPRTILGKRAAAYGIVYDRPPLMVSPGNSRVFLQEGGRIGGFTFPKLKGKDDDEGKSRDKDLRKAVEKKPEKEIKDGLTTKFDASFLGLYPSWCHGLNDDSCWICDEAHRSGADEEAGGGPWPPWLLPLILLGVLIGLAAWAYGTFSRTDGGGSGNAPSTWCSLFPNSSSCAGYVPPPEPEQPGKIAFEARVEFCPTESVLAPGAREELNTAAKVLIEERRRVSLRIDTPEHLDAAQPLWNDRMDAIRDQLKARCVPPNWIKEDSAGFGGTSRMLRIDPSISGVPVKACPQSRPDPEPRCKPAPILPPGAGPSPSSDNAHTNSESPASSFTGPFSVKFKRGSTRMLYVDNESGKSSIDNAVTAAREHGARVEVNLFAAGAREKKSLWRRRVAAVTAVMISKGVPASWIRDGGVTRTNTRTIFIEPPQDANPPPSTNEDEAPSSAPNDQGPGDQGDEGDDKQGALSPPAIAPAAQAKPVTVAAAPPTTQPPTTAPSAAVTQYPMATKPAPAPSNPVKPPVTAAATTAAAVQPPAVKPATTKPATPPPAAIATPPQAAAPAPAKANVVHVAYEEGGVFLSRYAYDSLASAVGNFDRTGNPITIRIFAIGKREADPRIWNLRLQGVKDELVRLGVPTAQISAKGSGPYELTVRRPLKPHGGRLAADTDVVEDPLSDP